MRKVLILMGDGINSERELKSSLEEAGGRVELCHVNQLLKNPKLIFDFELLAFPGGFSFGDEVKSGKILAEKISCMTHEILEFLSRDGRVLGICNGFQVLAQLGAFNLKQQSRSFTLSENNHKTFINEWVTLEISPDAQVKSPWFYKLQGSISLPIRHKEGRVVKALGKDLPFIPLTYVRDVNGSHSRSAGFISDCGNIFGLMPHPEVATRDFLHPFRDGAVENVEKIKTLFKNGLS